MTSTSLSHVPHALKLPAWQRGLVQWLIAALALGPGWSGVGVAQTATGLSNAAPHAGPVADARAPLAWRPAVQSSHGVPLVHITAPNAAGVSLNQYQRFDVPSQGVVLNNSQVPGTALLGAQVPANPNLVGGRTAATIVNEVTSTGSPGLLSGTLEVFGAPAPVIVANPNGITCDGCGVVNTPRLTLSSGRVQLLDAQGQQVADFGAVERVGFEVKDGQILIRGSGVEGTVGRLDLIGKTIAIDGPLRAHYLNQDLSSINLAAGSRRVIESATGGYEAPQATAGGSRYGGVAIDASVFGAMTAGQIRVISTDQGMGVNLRGPLLAFQQDLQVQSAGSATLGVAASARDIQIDSAGTLTLAQPVSAGRDLNARADANVFVGGATQARGDVNLRSARGNVTVANDLAVGGNLALSAASAAAIGRTDTRTQVAGNATVQAAQVAQHSQLTVGQTLDIQASDSVLVTGRTVAGADIAVQAGGWVQVQGPGMQANRDLTLQGETVLVQAPLVAGRDQTLTGQTLVQLDAPATAGRTLSLEATQVNITAPMDAANIHIGGDELTLGQAGEQLNLSGDLSLNMRGAVHVASALYVQGNTSIQSGASAVVEDVLQSGGNLYLAANDELVLKAPITSGGNTTLQAGTQLDAQGSITAQGAVYAVAGQDLTVQGMVQSGAGQRLEAGGHIAIAQGVRAGALNLTAGQSATVGGSVLVGGDANLSAQTLRIAGDLVAGGSAHLNVGTGGVTANNALADVDLIIHSAGQIQLGTAQALRDVQLQSQQAGVVSTNGALAGRDLSVSAVQAVILGGPVQSGQQLTLQAEGGALTIQGGAWVGGNAQLSGQGIAMQGLQAQGGVNIDAGAQSLLSHGAVQGGDDVALHAGQDIVVEGALTSGGATQLQAGNNAQTALIDTGGPLTANVGGNLSTQGAMVVRGNASVDAGGTLQTDGATVVLGDAQFTTGGAQHFGGSLQSTGQITLAAGQGVDVQGNLVANGDIQVDAGQGAALIVGQLGTAGQLRLQASGPIGVQSHVIANGGQIRSAQDGITIGGALQSTGDFVLSAQNAIDIGGLTSINGSLGATSQTGDIRFGDKLEVAGDLNASAGRSLLLQGDSRLPGQVQLQAATSDPSGQIVNNGQMLLGQSLHIDTQGDFINEGQVLVPGDIDIQARHILSNRTHAGGLMATGTLSAAATGRAELGAQGAFSAAQDMNLQAQGGMLQQGQLQAGQTLHYSGGALTSSGLIAANSVQIQAQLNQSGSVYAQDITVTGTTYNSGQMAAEIIELAAVGNSGAIGGTTVQIGGSTFNSGNIQAAGDLNIAAQGGGIDNSGTLVGQTVFLAGSDVSNSGQIQSGGSLSISAQSVRNTVSETSRCIAAQQVCSGAGGVAPVASDFRWTQTPATIVAGGPLSITTGTLSNQAVIQSAASVTVQASGEVDNTRSANDLYTDANAGSDAPSTNTGIIRAGGALEITAASLTNSGQMQAAGQVTLTSQGQVSNAEMASGDATSAGQMVGSDINITAKGLQNQGLIQASAGNVTLTLGSGGLNNSGAQATIATPGSLQVTTTGGVTNGAGANLLADDAIRIRAASFSNAGTVYGQSGPTERIDIQTTGAIQNSASGILIANSDLKLQGASYGNAGVVGSLGDAILVTPQAYAPASNPLIAKGKLDLQVGGVNVGVGQSWASDATSVSWSGTLTNHGAVELAGAASGNVLNQYTGITFRGGEPSVGNLNFRVNDLGAIPPEVVDWWIVGYSDVAQRAYFSAASLSGTLTNEASDVTIGSTTYNPIHVQQTIYLAGKDVDGKLYEWTGSGQSLARADATAGPATIVLQGNDPGTIVAGSLTLIGGDLTLDSGLDPATGQPLVDAARQRQVEQANLSGAQASTGTNGGSAASQGAEQPQSGQATPDSLTTGVAPSASAQAGAGTASPSTGNAPGRNLGLAGVNLSTPQAGVAALLSGRDAANYHIQLPQWDQMRGVPGGITAGDLSLQLGGNFTNRSDLQVQQNLIIQAAGGIDNFGAAMRAGGALMIEGQSLDNSQGLIQSGGLAYLRTTSGDIRATNGQFQSTASAIVLDAAGDIHLSAGSVKGAQGAALLAGGDIELGVIQRETNTLTTSDKNGTQTRELAPGEAMPQIQYGQKLHREQSVTHEGVQIDAGAGPLRLMAQGDIQALGAELKTEGAALLAGRNVSIEAAKDSHLDQNAQWRKGYDHYDHSYTETLVGGTVTAGQGVSVVANGDESQGQGNITLKGAKVEAGQGQAALVASGNIDVLAVNTAKNNVNQTLTKSSGFLSKKSSTSRTDEQNSNAQGSSISGASIALQAGRVGADGQLQTGQGDIRIEGSALQADGRVSLNAGRDITVGTAQSTSSLEQFEQRKKSGLSISLSSGISVGNARSKEQGTSTTVHHQGSALGGSDVVIQAGRDATIAASDVIADNHIQVLAGRHVNVLAERDSEDKQNSASSSGTSIGLAITSGKGGFTFLDHHKASSSSEDTLAEAQVSTLSANNGNLTIRGGLDATQGPGNVTIQGADLLAKERVSITGAEVDLQAVANASSSLQRSQSSGLLIGAKPDGVLGNLINSAEQAIDSRSGDSNTSTRLQNAQALKAGYDAYKVLGPGAGLDQALANEELLSQLPVGQGGTKVADPSSNALSVSFSVSAYKSQSESSQSSTSQRGVSIQGGQIDVTATSGDISMAGAKLQAQDISLDAARDIRLGAAVNTEAIHSNSKSNNLGAGVTIGLGGTQNGVSFQASASQSKANANADETRYDNTQIIASDTLSLKSGGDTTLAGAQLAGKRVEADIGGDLHIQSLQDQSQYESQSSSSGFNVSLCIPPLCAGVPVSGSVSVASSSINHSYQSAVGQSGIAAGEGGYDIQVGGHTQLNGGALTSTASADKNRLSTDTLGYQDLENHQTTQASASSASVGFGSGASLASNVFNNVVGNHVVDAGLPKDQNQQSQTQSVISAGQIEVRSNDAQSQQSSQQAAATLTSRDASTANQGLSNTLSLVQAQQMEQDRIKAQQDAQAAVTLGSVGANAWGDYATAQYNKAMQSGDTQAAEKWAEGGAYRVAGHIAMGAVTGGKDGAAGAGAAALAAPVLDNAQANMTQQLINSGMDPKTAEDAARAITGAGAALLGDVAGGSSGAVAAINVDTFNRQLHASEKTLAKQLAAKSGGKYTSEEIEEQMRLMGNKAQGVEPNTVTVLTGDDIAKSRDGVNDPLPLLVNGNVAVEVPGTYNVEIQQYILLNTTNGEGNWIPGGSTYVASLPPSNSTSTTPPQAGTATCANGDLACRSGVGAQQNPSLTPAQRAAV